MHRLRTVLVLLLGSFLLFGGCFGGKTSQNVEFYVLEYDPPKISGLEPISAVILVERLNVAPEYASNQIIYRDKSYKRDTYAYHKWRTTPKELVTQLLERDLKRSGLFKAVLASNSTFPATHKLGGSVDEFFEWDNEKSWKAVLSISITVVAEDEKDENKKILLQKSYHSEKPSKHRNPRSLAEAMSLAMAEISENIIRDVYNLLKDQGQENQEKVEALRKLS
jgi:ABC-type uncharacterized transport system auxiliary subunit